jgi:hypothetical protein
VLKRDLTLLVLLSVTAAWRWSPVIATDLPLPDERVYLRAARHVEVGESPYSESSYFYPPPLAHVIAATSAKIGTIGALRILRLLSIVGIVFSVWLSARLVSWHLGLLAGLVAIFIAFAPAVDIATSLGNAGGLATGLVLAALLCWHRRPARSSISLGAGLALKPIAPLAPLLILTHRSSPKSTRQVVVSVATVAIAGALLAPWCGQLAGFLENARGYTNPYNFSLHRLLADLGLELPPVAVSAVVGTLAVVIVRRSTVSRNSLLTIVIGTSLLALPILWAHTLLLLLPIQLLALDACGRVFARKPQSGRPTRLTGALASVSVAATLLAHAAGTTFGLPSWAGVIARAVPMSAVAFLTWFVVADLEQQTAERESRTQEQRAATSGAEREI